VGGDAADAIREMLNGLDGRARTLEKFKQVIIADLEKQGKPELIAVGRDLGVNKERTARVKNS
jgi:hypothetical protein